jgi:hypothetical protein
LKFVSGQASLLLIGVMTMSNVAVPKRLVELVGQSEFWTTALRKEADRLERYGQRLGVPVIVITAVTGTAIFTQLSDNPASWAKLIFGSVLLLATVLSTLQTYYRFPARAQQAKNSGEQFGKLFGRMLDAEDRMEGGENVPHQELQALYERYEDLKNARPSVSQWAQKQATKELEEKTRRRQR